VGAGRRDQAAKQSRNTDEVIFLNARKRSETNGCYHDIFGQTMGFDHVGTDQLNLSPVLPVEFGCDAQASPRGLTGKSAMGDRKPDARPYVLIAIIMAVAIWATMGSPHANVGLAKHHHARLP
jgi:hypothetical protein